MNKGIFPGFTQRPGQIRPYPRYDATRWPAKSTWLGSFGQDNRMRRTTVPSSAIRDTAFNGQIGVGIDAAGTTYKTSDGGITWVAGGALPVGTLWSSVIFSKVSSLFVAINADTVNPAAATSPDGTTWTQRATLTAGAWVKPAISDTGILFTAQGTTTGFSSANGGVTWTARTLQSMAASCQGVDFGNGLFIAYGSNGNSINIQSSPDLTTWTIRVGSAVLNLGGVMTGNAYGPGGFVAIGVGTTAGTNFEITSLDGIQWNMRYSPLPFSAAPNAGFGNTMQYGNGLYAYAGSPGLFVSLDGQSWRSPAAPIMLGVPVAPGNVSIATDRMFVMYGTTATTVLPYTDPQAQDLLYVP